MTEPDTKGLRLLARDGEDLRVIASALQDAVVAVGTLTYDREGRSFTLRASRYRHEADAAERVVSALRMDGVERVRRRGIDMSKPESFMVLLDIALEETDPPAGTLTLRFAGGGEVALDIEGLDLTLVDVGASRRVSASPAHD